MNPNDVMDEEAMWWLRALVWPDQLERAERLVRAIALARIFPPPLRAGNALEVVPELLHELPPATPVVLFHSFVLNQFPADARLRYYELLAEESAGRLLFDIAIEPSAAPVPMILTTLHKGERTREMLAACGQHGSWLEWTNGE